MEITTANKPAHTLPMPSSISRRFELVVGWDCEYESTSMVQLAPGEPPPRNKLLSYQVAWVRTRGDRAEGCAFLWARGDERPTLEDLLALCPYEKRVLLVAHAGMAELAHLSNRPRVMAIGKVPITFSWVRLASGQLVQFRDTMLLAAEGAKSLAALSETNEFWRKCDLTALLEVQAPALAADLARRGLKGIQAMAEVLRRAPDVYERYAMHDSWATLEYFLRFQTSAEMDYGVDKPSVTAVGLSQGAFIAARPDYKSLWGAESVTEPDEWGKTRTNAKVCTGRAASETLATECYKGGLNTAYKHGWTLAHSILDVDMVGAYASSMATLREIDWESHSPTLSLKAFTRRLEAGGYGFAHCSYSYPASAKGRQTSLGDREGGAGLVYFRQGTCHATGDEVLHALAMGARIELHQACTYETKDELPFAAYLASVAARRIAAKAKKDKHGDLLAKLVGNGLYGKLGQGLGSRTTTIVADGDKAEPMRKSSLTSPQYASYCTGRVRCAMADLVNGAWSIGMEPLCATTDGPMIAMAKGLGFGDLLTAYLATPFGALMKRGRLALGDDAPPLVVKAAGVRALVCRTRTNALFDAADEAVTGAWTGWHGAAKDDQLRSRELAEAFDADDKQSLFQRQGRLPSPYEIYSGGEEYRLIPKVITLRVDYDHKRALGADGRTTTWTSKEDYAQARKLAERLHDYCHCGHKRARHALDPMARTYGTCTGPGRKVPCAGPCQKFEGFPATHRNLSQWPRAVPRESPKSAPSSSTGPGVGPGREPKAERPPRARKPRPPAGGAGPRKGTVHKTKPGE